MMLFRLSLTWAAALVLLRAQISEVYADASAGIQGAGDESLSDSCMELNADGTVGACENETTGEEESDLQRNLLLTEPRLVTDLIDWIREHGGEVDRRQEVRREGNTPDSPRKVYATSRIPAGTTLCRVPWKLILAPDDPESDNLCDLVAVVQREFQRYVEEGTSKFAPYLRLLHRYAHPMLLPDGWSEGGKELLSTVLGDYLPPRHIGSHLTWYRDSCRGNLDDEKGVQAALLVIGYRSNGFKTPDKTNDKFQEAMMPFFDIYSHRDGPYYNTALAAFDVGSDIEIIASRDIKKGEAIHGSVGFGTPLGTPRLLRDGGVVEELPRYFSFELKDDSDYKYSFAFQVEEPDEFTGTVETNQTLVVKWPEGRPIMDKAMQVLQKELDRLVALQDVLQPDASYVASVPRHERDMVAKYHEVLVEGIGLAIKAEIDPFAWTPFTQTDFVVAGVNLGSYKMEDEEDDLPPSENAQPPFELYSNFDIGDMIQGTEGWKEILKYRNTLERPSLSFYVDKIARKRWLPQAGFDQPKLYALHYGSEITGTGDIEDERKAIFKLLPNNTDFAAKPGHFSETNGIWLVSRDLATNETIVSSTARQLVADDMAGSFDNWVVAESLAKDLHGVAKPYESWALKNVHPGFVVEERLVDFYQWDRPPLELCIFVIWGRVWCGQMNYIEDQHRFFGAFIYRNGTTVKGSFHKSIPFDWLDWPELVRQAEELGKHKDMFRADFFVGIPASSSSLRNGSYDEKVKDLRIVVSESEIYPTTTFHSDSLPADAARLWIAGYKKGNYILIPNDEVPKEFVDTGRLSEPNAK